MELKTWLNSEAPAVAEALEVELPLDEYDTFGGLIFGVYGSVPDDGVQFEIDVENLHVKVTEILEHRLESAVVCRNEACPDKDTEDSDTTKEATSE